jgi:hypothetical protein
MPQEGVPLASPSSDLPLLTPCLLLFSCPSVADPGVLAPSLSLGDTSSSSPIRACGRLPQLLPIHAPSCFLSCFTAQLQRVSLPLLCPVLQLAWLQTSTWGSICRPTMCSQPFFLPPSELSLQSDLVPYPLLRTSLSKAPVASPLPSPLLTGASSDTWLCGAFLLFSSCACPSRDAYPKRVTKRHPRSGLTPVLSLLLILDLCQSTGCPPGLDVS